RHDDSRGTLVEVFREEWQSDFRPIQWNAVTSEVGVLRGIHVHLRHWDYLVVLKGAMSLAVKDLRRNSPTSDLSAVVHLESDDLHAVIIPPLVAHGFYFHKPSLHIYAVSHYWDPDDELGCHWADPELNLPWQIAQPVLSERDGQLPGLKTLMEQIRAAFP
ncbi:MAG TPA: dTDP-4-dehydrorhamnose 3,5-epimerase family protein, partial [Candidatus Obscuribacterales bacterium]